MYYVKPRQFYEFFPIIGALLGMQKIFSLVSIYNQANFEKELDMSLKEPNKYKEEEIENF